MYNVVLVDDEELILQNTKTLLEGCAIGCRIVGTAHSGIEGAALIRALKPDFVVTDVVMPGLSGLEMIDDVLSEMSCRFIIVSGYQEFDYVRHALRKGVVDYLLKPIVPAELETAVRRIVGEEKEPEEDIEEKYGSLAARVLRLIDENYRDPVFSLSWLCDNELFMNATYVGRLFQNRTGQKFTTRLMDKRLEEALVLMKRDRDLSLTEIAERTGFSSLKYFTESFKKKYGASPGAYRQAASDERKTE